MLGKRAREDSSPSAPAPTSKKRKEDTAFTSYPTPESTQLSSTDSSSEESSRSRQQDTITSNSGLSSVRRIVSSQSKSGSAATAKTRFFSDLNNYVPLGSLTLSLSIGGDVSLRETEWTELGQDPDIGLWPAFHDNLSANDGKSIRSAGKLCESGFARVFSRKHQKDKTFATIRVYVLPNDVGRRYLDRHVWKGSSNLRSCVEQLIKGLDITFESWEGSKRLDGASKHYDVETKEDESLFYLFNTLPSPSPSHTPVTCPVSRDAIQSVLSSVQVPGLITQLYQYQKRTVADMIQREVKPKRALDPRFQALKGPTGCTFFYDNVTGVLLRDGNEYEEVRGGILGESMGLGKTLICLAAIVATQGHWPEIPPEYSINLCPVRQKVGSLMQMAAAAVGRNQVPWRALFQDALRAGQDHQNLTAILEDSIGSYVIPPPQTKYSRRSSIIPKGKTVRLSTATLIIAPQNLLSQWRTEISLHIEDDRLKILYLESGSEGSVPPADRLLQYDVILMSRQRFEKEMAPSESVKASSKAKKAKGGCLCPLDQDCHCSRSDEYQSPLKDLHWFRIIMDEGHEFSSSGKSGTAYWALRNLRVDRKWIVSGTPANGLLGVEVGIATHETFSDDQSKSTQDLLEARRKESALSQERKDLEKLGILVTGFLQVKPWSNGKEEDPASWQKYIMPHQDGRRKAKSLGTLLKSLVVRHRIEDVEADIQLPPLYNRVVYLQPSWHDKLSINLFILNLTVNAITSERVDEDYMFHPKNRRQLNTLINNLRQAGFYWTGIQPEVVAKTLNVSRGYLEEHASKCTEADKLLLERVIAMGELVLASESWKSFADLHEMGIFVEEYPEKARDTWSLISTQHNELLLTGATQLTKAQRWVDNHLYAADVVSGLVDLGSSTMHKVWQASQREADTTSLEDGAPHGQHQASQGSPHSKSTFNLPRVPRLTSQRTVSRAKVPQKVNKIPSSRKPFDTPHTDGQVGVRPTLKSALKQSTKEPKELLPPESPLVRSKICGTASAKLSYLLDRVAVLHQEEKILIFYEGDHIAWYIAQALDLIDIRYLIYTKSLPLERQAAYIATFNETETFRVLLMNVHQAAHGLHIASASRVFFVNPLWQPNVEAQAIKRAHRIGQTRSVYVETLVLQDTLEDQMLQRRKGMTAQEHQKAERSLLDDSTMSTIIQQAQPIPFLDSEVHDVREQVAKLQTPQQIFGRVSKGEGDVDDPDADLLFPGDMPGSVKHKKEQHRNKVSGVVDCASVSPPLIPQLSLTGRRIDGVRLNPSRSVTHIEELETSGSSFGRQRVAFEDSTEIDEGKARIERKSPVHSIYRRISEKPARPGAFPETSTLPSPRTSASPSSIGRVGFALDALKPINSEPPSLFGDGTPVRLGETKLGIGDGQAMNLAALPVASARSSQVNQYFRRQQTAPPGSEDFSTELRPGNDRLGASTSTKKVGFALGIP